MSQPVIVGRLAVVVVAAVHFTVTWIPCSLPIGHVPLAADRLRLVPFGPLAKIRNVWPAFADPKQNNASINVGDSTTNLVDWITFAEFAMSTANTDVTFVVPFGSMKQLPVINRSWQLLQSNGPEGDAEITTGALNPKSNTHVVLRVNPPVDSRLKMLLLPALNVTTSVSVANPPQHASGNAVPGNPGCTASVPWIRFWFTGVTFDNGIARSGTPSPFVSQVTVSALVTVLPALCNGNPVESAKPWQIIVVSFGIIPHPIMSSVTAHSALIIPAVGVATLLPAPFGVAAAADPTAGCPGATGTVPFGTIAKHIGFGGN